LVPLWQAPDEQAHFEYAALIAEQRHLPDEKAVSPKLRREIVAAMPEQNWNRFMGWKVEGGDVLPGSTPDIPGPAELRHPPLYYVLGATLLWPLNHQEISVQLYILRFYSVLLGTLTLAVVYAAARELFPKRRRLQMAVPLLLLFIPAHTFLSSTVNNDRLAELILSAQFLLWIRIFRRGLNWRRALGIAALLGLGLWTKGTTAVGFPLAGLALLIWIWPRASSLFSQYPWGRVAIPVAGAALLFLIRMLIIDPHNVQGWTKTGLWSSQDDTCAYSGEYAIRVQPGAVYQRLPPSAWESLAGKRVLLSAWVRAKEGTQGGYLRVSDSRQTSRKKFAVGDEWSLQVLETQLYSDTKKLWVYLGNSDSETELYFDAVQLIEIDAPPDDLQNLLDNGSGEVSQWDLKPRVYSFIKEVLHLGFDTWFFGSLFDWRRSVAFREQYWTEAWILLSNFWASLGVRQVNPSSAWQWALASWSLVSVAGMVLWIKRESCGQGEMTIWQKQVLKFFMIATVLVFVIVMARLHPLPAPYYPHGRYLYIGIVPIIILLVFGWRELVVVKFKIAHKNWLLAAGVLAGCLFDAMMLFDHALPYFYGPV